MTLQKLLVMLQAIPWDCRHLPVFIDGDDGQRHLVVIEVFPPDNGHGTEPHIVLSDRLEGAKSANNLLIEHRRLPGTG